MCTCACICEYKQLCMHLRCIALQLKRGQIFTYADTANSKVVGVNIIIGVLVFLGMTF